MIKLIMFDFDGVIDENYELHYKLSRRKFIDFTREEHKSLFEGNIHAEREKLKHRDTGFDFLKELSDTRYKREIKKATRDALRKLSGAYTLGVVSSSPEYGVAEFIEENDIHDIFNFIYGFNTHRLKTYKFKKVLEEYGLEPHECIYVADTLGDILEAREVGIETIAVDFGFHDRERLLRGNPKHIISSFEELIELLRE